MKKLILGLSLIGSLSSHAGIGMNIQGIEGTYENMSIAGSEYEIKVERNILRIKNSDNEAENLISLSKDCTEEYQSSGLLPYDLPLARIVHEFKTCTREVGENYLEGTISKKKSMKVFYFLNESSKVAGANFKITRFGDDISLEIEQLNENQDSVSLERIDLRKH